ncbi:MAG TPA: hypothetical protein VGM80_17110 [Gaiellaceae bacterium]
MRSRVEGRGFSAYANESLRHSLQAERLRIILAGERGGGHLTRLAEGQPGVVVRSV